MKEPLERAAAPQVRLGYWIALFVGVLVIAAFLFPGAVAIVGVILALPIIIFLHELAHFVTAKPFPNNPDPYEFGSKLFFEWSAKAEPYLKASGLK